jgi:hypothetical protein
VSENPTRVKVEYLNGARRPVAWPKEKLTSSMLTTGALLAENPLLWDSFASVRTVYDEGVGA